MTPSHSSRENESPTTSATDRPRDGATDLTVERIDSAADRAAYDAFIRDAHHACAYHPLPVVEALARAFRHRAFVLAARRGGAIVAALPLVEQRSFLFGRSMTSMPALTYAGIACGRADAEGDDLPAREALVDAAGRLALERGAAFVELRHDADLLPDRPRREHKVAMRLALPDSPEALWKAFGDKVRNQVRKAEKLGLTGTTVDAAAGLDGFYSIFAENMRNLGTPVYGRRFFAEVLDALGERAQMFHVVHEGQPIAASIVVRHPDRVEVPWAASRWIARPLCANHLLYRTMLDWTLAQGARVFDFGRTTIGSGPHQFKVQWGAKPHPLYWHYWLPPGVAAPPERGPSDGRFGRAIEIWKRLPIWVTRWIGPPIARSLP